MKLTPHLKKGWKLYTKDAAMLIISFLIFPMALSIIYGGMQKNLFEGRDHLVEPIEVYFKYDEASEKGTILKDILSKDDVKKLFITGDKNAEYHVTISADFEDVEITGSDEGAVQFTILKNFMETLLNNFIQYDVLNNSIGSLNIGEAEKGKLIENITASLTQYNQKPFVKEIMVEGYKTLSSFEYYTISMFSFTSLILVVTLAGYFYKDVKEGIVKRTLSTPNDKVDYFLGFFINSFIISVAMFFIYVLINRIRGAAFLGNPLSLALIILLQGFLCASTACLVIAFIKKEMTASVVMNLVLVVPSIFGGVFFYSEIIDSKIMKAVMNSVPNALILNSYKNLAITGTLQSIQGDLILMAILSLLFLGASIVKIRHKWEV